MVSEAVVGGVQNYLKALRAKGIEVRFGIVIGSQVTGNAGRWSDIDLVVVSPRFDGKRNRGDIETLWRTAARVNCRIEPIACGEKQWREDDATPIIEIARQNGQVVMADGESRP